MKSPIDILKEHVFPALLRNAPERSNDLIGLIKKHGVRFAFDGSADRILFTADSSNRLITVGEGCLERLWACSCAYFIFYDKMRSASQNDPATHEIRLGVDPELDGAMNLLSWATSVDWQVAAEGGNRTEPLPNWPLDLPMPIANPEKGSNEDIADKLFLSALGFILHHELAHIRLDLFGSEGVDSILAEKEADREAARWLVDGLDEQDERFSQRILGVATALCWLASLNAYVSFSSRTHPPGYDRLFQVLSGFVTNDWHDVWIFVATPLMFHLDASGIKFDSTMRHQNPREAVNFYCDLLSRRCNSEGE